MRLPHSFDSPVVLNREELEAMFMEYAAEWLSMIGDTAPAHRGDYGNPQKVVITSFIPVFPTG